MSRQSMLVAGFLSQITVALIFANSALALNAGETNSVLSCVENDRSGQVTLTTRSRSPIAAPQVSYLPGEDGEIIMTADFEGLSFTLPTRVIRLSDDSIRHKGIREIRIGQLQASPPVCRVSVITGEMRALKDLNFKTSAGVLTIRWPADHSAQPAQVANQPPRTRPPEADSRVSSNAYSTGAPNYQQGFSLRSAPTPGASSPGVPLQPNNISPTFAGNTISYESMNQNQGLPLSQRSGTQLRNQRAEKIPPLAPSITQRSGISSTYTPGSSSYLANSDLPVLDLHANRKTPSSAPSQGKPSTGITTYRTTSSFDQHQPLASASTQPTQSSQSELESTSSEMGDKPSRKKKKLSARQHSEEGVANADETQTPNMLAQYPEDDKPPIISLSVERDPSMADKSASAFRLKIKSDHSLTYNTFRLNNPERYVIDFANCPELVDAQLPEVGESEFIRSVRVGQPDDPSKTRLVIDLINEPVTIKEQTQREANFLTIRLSRSLEAADTAASQVAVPTGTTIVLDAGHGGSDPGAQRGDVQEKEITLGIIERLKKRLEARGFRIALTRSDDTFVSLEDRVRITNNLQPSLFLSVHINAMESANDIHGIETYYQTEQSRTLADTIHENLVTKLDAPDRAVRKARFYVINHTSVPAVLAEVGFISNKDERDKLISSDYQTKVANALEQGVMLYLDKQLARGQVNSQRAFETRTLNSAQSGTMQPVEKSHNTSLAQRKNQFEDSTR